MQRLTWAHVRARRLARHSLVQRSPPDRLVEVVSATCGIHAQVMAAAELSLAARLEGLTRQDVHDALWRDRTLVKAWTIRGTLHLHPADELSLWYAARRAAADTASDDEGLLAPWRDPEGVLHPALEPEDVKMIRAAVRDALEGRCLLREELAEAVVRRVGPRPRERLRSGFAFFLDEVCQGPPQGAKITLVRPEQWLGGWRDVDPREALRTVCRRYLHAFGPTRPEAFREWFSARAFKADDARVLFASLGSELEEVEVEGRRAFVLRGDARLDDDGASVRLLPEYDAYVMGFRERDELVPAAVREQVAQHGRGRYEGPAGVRFLLVDGVAAGLWQRKKRGRRLELTVEPAKTSTRAVRRALEREASRFADFLALEPALEVASPGRG
jgi:Winged helix DNA-binding domain